MHGGDALEAARTSLLPDPNILRFEREPPPPPR
jgi:hypothetical protein